MSLSEKDIEEFHLNLLRQSLPTFPQGSLVRSESPDFILDYDSKRIGIEITRLFKSADSFGRHLQVQENERTLLVAESLALYERMKLPCIEVRISFGAQTSFNKKNREEFAERISFLISSNVPIDQSWVRLENKFNDPNTFPCEIDSISIARYGHTKNFWSIPGAGWVQEDFVSELQLLIDRKNRLVTNFNQHCNFHWLVVVLEGMTDSTLFDPSDRTLNHIYESKYDKIFLLDRFRAKGYELQIASAA